MSEKAINFDLTSISNGAVQEKWDKEMKRVAENIIDPNTDATKKRKVTLTMTLTPNKDRSVIDVDTEVKSTIAPQASVATTMMAGRDLNTGEIAVNELKSGVRGQTFIDQDGTVKTDTGTPIEEIEKQQADVKDKSSKLVDFQAQKKQEN
ncbi:replication terminator protein [Lactiplantibacillus plantarum]|uniref:replication terminator protein n=1 Tax=Lactiplantibacillus plantarum TaxID=1590 RepID=UPI002182307E|nr:replication terminator protein [Lactiplantibacillus plantarum]MCS8620194.1 replication terminator protein [Lactiplantibacillus plantarum]MCT3214506.1 replication terminator protein [Lactiplantibacillus plantarum]MCT3270717.1 replication terminator protein [Lactiplantibacillus plantarum]